VIEISPTGGSDFANMAASDLLEIPAVFANIYTNIMSFVANEQIWIVSAIIFAMIIGLAYVISLVDIDYSNYIAIAVGAFINILGFILAALLAKLQIGIVGLIASTAVSMAIAAVIQFFGMVLDYSAAERVQFEDEDYYYYVKAVPKVSVKHTKDKRKPIKTKKKVEK